MWTAAPLDLGGGTWWNSGRWTVQGYNHGTLPGCPGCEVLSFFQVNPLSAGMSRSWLLLITGKQTLCYWTWPFISLIYLLKMVIFHSYVSFPEGMYDTPSAFVEHPWHPVAWKVEWTVHLGRTQATNVDRKGNRKSQFPVFMGVQHGLVMFSLTV